MSNPPQEKPPSMAGAAVGAGLGCVVGAIIVPIIVFVVVLITERFDPVCGTPGDSGGCEMGLAADTLMAVIPGNLLWILFGGLWMAVGWVVAALIMAVTVVGLPWTWSAITIASYTLLPFGHR